MTRHGLPVAAAAFVCAGLGGPARGQDPVHPGARPDRPTGIGVGASVGLASGIGPTVRFPVGPRNRVAVTFIGGAIPDAGGLLSTGVRFVRYLAVSERGKLFAVGAGGLYLAGGDGGGGGGGALGGGLGYESGPLLSHGTVWWADLALTAGAFADAAFLLPLPEAGVSVEF